MARIFHQNMEKFTGTTAKRIKGYTTKLGAINTKTGSVYLAAGFTEVFSCKPVLRKILTRVARKLDPGLTKLVVIEVGTTACTKNPEYIGIAWDPDHLTVQYAGQVYYDLVAMQWKARRVEVEDIVKQTVDLPARLSYGKDTRGLAYIGCSIKGKPFLIGFMHNMYKMGERNLAFTALPDMGDKVRKLLGEGYSAAEVIIGGDFNVEPRNPKPERGDALHLAARAARVGGGLGGAYIKTTNKHPYDFWAVSNKGITDVEASVHTQTRAANCSDHAGISLVRK
jgi:hypothetical protein